MSTEKEARMTVRMPSDLYEWLKADAESDLRSLNSQVVAILDEHRKKKLTEQKSNN